MSKAYLNISIVAFIILSLIFQFIFTFDSSRLLFYLSLLLFLVVLILMVKNNQYLFKSCLWVASLITSVILSIIILYFTENGGWIVTALFIILYPALFEEIIFRGYVLFSLKKHGNLISVVLSSVIYVLYYSRFVFLDNFKAFPFPYNVMMLLSMFSMGLIYSLLDLKINNIYPSTIIHYLIWSLFPILAVMSPALASLLVPT